ncbi:uncharacterized protein LOC100835286 [Brachypodium distachyon]|uniref:EamA domain-containing protein n=1 Tax=Brachypodium distachyon TaxID=15368 RepID=I1GZ44_BRADI|nr:uncharacterized protein LOC100835286 [Brachypodium distachyon]KQK18639.1 hypothetical protein BRADI_1g43800v3 [Brachypodium distachyon]|eukprot:XP_003560823.2 uncharacterized protein LOC100835286 [Brachypodium distachyon]
MCYHSKQHVLLKIVSLCPSSGEMLLSKLPNPPRPWRPRSLETHPRRHRQLPLPNVPVMPVPRRRQLLSPSAASSDYLSEDPELPPAKRFSSKKALGESGRWKVVPPKTPKPSTPDPQEPPSWFTVRRQAHAAWRKVTLLVPSRARSVILLNLVVLIFASNISVVKEAQSMLDPDLFNVLRFSIAAIPFVPFLLKSLRDMQVFIRGVELGIWVTLAFLAQSIGLVTADAGRASFISALTVIIVPLLDGILGAEIPIYTWLGALLSMVGVGILELSGSPPCVGDLLTLLSAFCFAIHMLRTEHISRNMKKDNFLALVGCQVLVLALVSAASFIVKRLLQSMVHWNLKSQTPTQLFSMMAAFPWLAILYTGILSTTFCLWAEVVAMRDVSATETAIIYGLEPVWGAAFAWAIHGERWGVTGLIGAIFIIAGSLMVQILGSFLDVSGEDSYQMNS